MLTIRLQRTGRKNVPTFRVVLTEKQNGPKSGRFLEVLGSYDPRGKGKPVIDAERASYWLSKGAQVSDTMYNFLVDAKVISGKKKNVLPKKSPIKKDAPEGQEAAAQASAEAPAAEAPAPETPKAEA